jgi:AcrR family transcriptional regulator
MSSRPKTWADAIRHDPALADCEAAFAGLDLPRFADLVDNKESEIIVAAFHCIAEIGIAATSTRAVARRAGLNQGSIHYYFRSKDELLLGVLKRLMMQKAAIGRAIRETTLTPTQKMYCLLRSGSNFMQHRDEVIATVALWGHALTQGGVWTEIYRDLFDEFRADVVAMIDEGVATGEFHNADSRVVAETIIMAIQGIGMHYLINPKDFESQNLVDRVVGLFFRILEVENA